MFQGAVTPPRRNVRRVRLIVLGTPCVSIDGQRTPVSGPLQRLLLALLARNRHEPTSVDTLVDALWPDEVGDRLESRLQLHVHRIRARFGAGTILSVPGGYRLGLAEDQVDAWLFDSLVNSSLEAHRLPSDGTDVLVRLEEGLALWGGEPFSGLEHPDLEAERQRLCELYLLGQETRVQHRLDRGHHEVARVAVAPLAGRNPLRERLQALWMTALHQAGEQTAALEVYRDTRRRLVDELGIEPGSELQGIHELVLAGAPESLSGDAPAVEPAGVVAPGALRAGRVRQGLDVVALLGEATSDVDRLARELCDRGEYAEAEQVLRSGIELDGDTRQAARWRRDLALVVSIQGRQSEALDLQSRAETWFHLHDDAAHQARLLDDMAVVCSLTGDLHRSCRVLEEASEVRRAAGLDDTHTNVVRALVLVHMRRLDAAAELLQELAARGPTGPMAITLARANSQLRRRRGEHPSGIEWAERAVVLAQEGRAHWSTGLVLVDLGSCLRDAGNDRCFEAYEEAIQTTRGAGQGPAAAMAHAALAKAWLLWEDPGRATVQAREALRLAQGVESWGFAARANARLGDAAEALGESMRASWYRHEALACWRRVDYPVPRAERARLEALVGPQPAVTR